MPVTTGTEWAALDAASAVLGAEKRPMTAAEIIEAARGRRLWSAPETLDEAGELEAAIATSINRDKKYSRFLRCGPTRYIQRPNTAGPKRSRSPRRRRGGR